MIKHYELPLAIVLLLLPGAALAETPWVTEIESPQYFAVSVKDLDRVVDWYRNAFDLEILDDTSDKKGAWRIVNLRNSSLFVELIYDQRNSVKEKGKALPRGIAKVGFRVPDVRVVAQRIEQATGKGPRVLDFAKHDIRLIQLRDPEDNIIQLTSPLAEEEGP